ncbi:23S rRNA (uracil(1939)-C(5))-methyltransferase RlmD [Streptococcus pantholopis]|uniref:23S rRNA (Uracil-5-)-methyltransferase RumA n=1 Tax=Streptococcus pantholopis TaxID=1811193 RepID=A0A172Q8L5_9STRE|nr:23S rRNA (uracil(1939)-C(5))-methyltransferase RlmD [Streptococcus pantholopis]AND79800.1 23S rRNA (uracil-5-)-methyltransferase RumA [Streptococcus pantholopis]
MNLSVKQKIPLKIKRLGINGEGIGFYKKTLVFVPGALQGENIFCQITNVKRNFAEAKLLKINKKSKFRVQPACSVYEACGGCQLMHLRYDKQLSYKEDIIRQSLKKFKPEGYENYKIRPTIGMTEPTHYRAKLQFQVGSFSGSIKAGLYAANSHRLIAIEDCLVQDKTTQQVMNTITDLLAKYRLPIYKEGRAHGIRTVMIRKSQATKQLQLIFITSKSLDFTDLIHDLLETYPEIRTVALNINADKTSQIYGEKTVILWGEDTIEEEVLDYGFSLSPRAFYQLNPQQTQVLYSEVVKAMAVTGEEDLLDAYCGVGTIGLAFAGKVKSVRGMDIIPEAIADAKANAASLGLTNAHYEVGKAEELIPRWYKKGYRATALVVDPPRTGLDSKLLAAILRFPPSKMVYVSCNASTLARDLVKLAAVYQVKYIQSVDMFPHTARTEAVVKLVRKSKNFKS